MLPAAPNFSTAGQSLPQFSLQNAFAPGPSYGPHPQVQPGSFSQALQDPLLQGADPNSPEVFKANLRLVHQQVLELQAFARRVLLSIQNAYLPGNSPVQIEANIAALKQILAGVIEKLRQSGVGALPLIPPPSDPSQASLPPSVPSEKELLESTTSSLRTLYEKLQRSQESAAIVANLLTTDHSSRAGK